MTEEEAKMADHKIVIVTGFSGAGMSSALKNLEDMGYEVFDNFPLSLLEALLADSDLERRPIAVGIDSRARGFAAEELLAKTTQIGAFLLFITAETAVLQQRFAETRRRHPLAKDRPASAGIKAEQELLHSLRKQADLVVDTSALSIHELRRILSGHFDLSCGQHLIVTVMSFGFKHGIPREADILMDARFLKNPHWDNDLRPLTGRDKAVIDYIKSDKGLLPFTTKFKALLMETLPRYRQEGKSYLTIALGCTGGRHRSVYLAETTGRWLDDEGYAASVWHRDLDR